MKRIYKQSDIAFNLTLNYFPIDINQVEQIDFTFYTTNPADGLKKNKSDIKDGILVIQWFELAKLPEGVLYYDYKVNNQAVDSVTNVMTDFFIMSGVKDINIDVKQIDWGKIKGDIKNQTDLTDYVKHEVEVGDAKKVDKVEGKSLIDNTEIERLTTLHNYNDDLVKADIRDLKSNKLDKVEAKATYLPIGNYLTLHLNIDHKVDKEEGKSLVLNSEIERLATLHNYDDKKITSDIQSLATTKLDKTEAEKLYQPVGKYLTEHQDISGKVDKVNGKSLIEDTEIARLKTLDNYDDSAIKKSLDTKLAITDASNTYLKKGNYLTEHQSLVGYAKEDWVKGEIEKKPIGIQDLENRILYLNTLQEYKDLIKAGTITEPNLSYILETDEIKYYKNIQHKFICEVTPSYFQAPFISGVFLIPLNGEVPMLVTEVMGTPILDVESLVIDGEEIKDNVRTGSGNIDFKYIPVPDKYKNGGQFEVNFTYKMNPSVYASMEAFQQNSLAIPTGPIKIAYLDDECLQNSAFVLESFNDHNIAQYIVNGYTTDVYFDLKQAYEYNSSALFKFMGMMQMGVSPLKFHFQNYDPSIYGNKDDVLSFDGSSGTTLYGVINLYVQELQMPFTVVEE